MKGFIKILAFLLAVVFTIGLFSACNVTPLPEESSVGGESSSLVGDDGSSDAGEPESSKDTESSVDGESSKKPETSSEETADPEPSSNSTSSVTSKPTSSENPVSKEPSSFVSSLISSQASSKPANSSSKPAASSKPASSVASNPSNDDPSVKGSKAYFLDIWEKELAYLASMQASNGAFPMTLVTNGNATMNPYFADFAALALLDAGKKYQSNVKKYIQWHMAHLNTATTDYNKVDGTIYDYTLTIRDGVVTKETIVVSSSTGKKQYDSTDSYAATFLMVCQKYAEKTGDTALIKGYANEIARIINAMCSTLANDLTYAKPDYKVQYLMDNCEVYAGFVAAEALYRGALSGVSNASSEANKMQKYANAVSAALESRVWNKNKNYYETAVDKYGNSMYTFDWTNFYPCATSQMFPVLFGVISPTSTRAKDLYAKFNQNFSNGKDKQTWEEISIPDAFFWGSIPEFAAMMGDVDRVTTYVTNYERVMKRHAYPLHNSDIAHVAMACYIMASQL